MAVKHAGEFKEILPVLFAEDASLDWNNSRISLQDKKSKMVINLGPSVKVSEPEHFMKIGNKICRVFELQSSNRLEYEFVFE